MKDKEAIVVLQGLIARKVLTIEEEEAVRSAIGILSWTSLAESGIKRLKEKKERADRALDDV
jgi:hypothetical protein